VSDTLAEEEPVPDTLSDPPPAPADASEPAAPPPAPTTPPKRLSGKQKLVLAATAAGAALVVAMLAVYLFVIRYEPVARRHIPGNVAIAARVELSKVILFGPVRDHLWPLVAGARSGSEPSRLAAIADETGVDLRTDSRELVIASTDGVSWVAALGGRFSRGRFVKGLAKVARAERWPSFHLDGEFLIGPGGVAFAQADDGTIIVGSNAAVAAAALPASDEYKRLDLADDEAVTFAVTHEAWGGASGALGMILEHTPALGRVDRASGKLSLGSQPELKLKVEAKLGQKAIEVARDLETTVSELRVVTLLMPDIAGEKAALGALRIATTADGAAVTVTTLWPVEGLDRACAHLESLLRAAGAGSR
jgi:hypothetical protein